MGARTGAGTALLLLGLYSGLAAPARAQTARVPGQTPPPDPVTAVAAMLRSDDAREEAWGAWSAERDGLRRLAPELQQVVARRLHDSTLEGRAALDVALDGLIQLKAPPGGDALFDLFERRPVQALILSSLERTVPEPFLVHVLRTAESENWFTAANLLLAIRSQGLARELLDGLRLRAIVHLVDSGAVVRSDGGGMRVGCGGSGSAGGLPPWPAYDLTTFAQTGLTVLASGPVTTYYRRIVAPAGQTPAFCDSSQEGPTATHRLQYLAHLIGRRPEDLPVRGHTSRSVVWQSAAQADVEIERVRAEIADGYRRLLRMLAAADVLSEDAIGEFGPPQIDLDVNDLRGRR